MKNCLTVLLIVVIMIFSAGCAKKVPDDPTQDALVSKIKGLGDSKQVILVTGTKENNRVKVEAFEKSFGKWKTAIEPMDGVIGLMGFGKTKEGDEMSPVGIFKLGTAFGSEKKPSGVKMPYKKTTDQDYWVSDSTSKDYNKWITYSGDPQTKWKDYESLRILAYKYAFVIDYNHDCVPGKGSAIFFHIWSNKYGSTAGCTAVSEESILKVLKWLDPAKKPLIVQGTSDDIAKLTK